MVRDSYSHVYLDHISKINHCNSTTVRRRFGNRKLVNPLGYSDFGFATANEAEPTEAANGSANGGAEAKMEVVEEALETMALAKPASSVGGGAAGKFRKKEKKKKKNKNF